jgi:4-diphosphocytidyl-2-C-methyl-D-erythritol kinase
VKAIYDVPAPAKLNVFLHIVGRRADGYHLIQSAFMLIDWYDTLHFELRQDGQINRIDLGQPGANALPHDDLTVRAAKALQDACATTLGVNITLEKRIPSQAGMGGGSSDAASCLLALQRLWGVSLPEEKLLQIALRLGADVPFFVCGGSAWVEGIGEHINVIELPQADFVVVKPRQGLATEAIFSSPHLNRNTETATMESFAKTAESGIFEFGRNDLEPVAIALCPEIEQSLVWLDAQKLKGRMTGSGSAVFAQLPHQMELPVAPSDWQVRRCRNLQVHPLVGW